MVQRMPSNTQSSSQNRLAASTRTARGPGIVSLHLKSFLLYWTTRAWFSTSLSHTDYGRRRLELWWSIYGQRAAEHTHV